MSTPRKDEFKRRLGEEWLPDYCNDSKRRYSVEGFRAGQDNLLENDADDFLRALDHGVVTFGERQRLQMAHGRKSETLFWEGLRNVEPRPISLWLESVITVAVGARLHLDYGWPIDSLGMQSKDDAFDMMAYHAPDFTNEHIAVEVKKSGREVDELLSNLTTCCAGEHAPSCIDGKRMNAHRKWVALHARQPPLFWAVGPYPDAQLFEVIAAANASIRLETVRATACNSPACDPAGG